MIFSIFHSHRVPTSAAIVQALGEPQWINCDVRSFDYTVLGKFGVIMADPPWEIHMDLPYGIITDDEMRLMDIQCLQDDGVIFLWVTGRAMELGRELLEKWGYNVRCLLGLIPSPVYICSRSVACRCGDLDCFSCFEAACYDFDDVIGCFESLQYPVPVQTFYLFRTVTTHHG